MTEQIRWDALDALRGVSVMAMLLNLNPGAWEHAYGWLVHARWEGGTVIDMVAPAFLFCIGAALPLSLKRRLADGASAGSVLAHIARRVLALTVLGLALNAFPAFDWAHLRLPGVLQRIGLGYGIASLLVLVLSRQDTARGLVFRPALLAGAASFVLLSYWLLLYVVPVPGFGAPRFDPIGSWPAFVDRALFGPDHMFKYWPVDGRITFDPDGLLSTYPVLFNILLGSLAGILRIQHSVNRPAVPALGTGVVLMALALLLQPVCPIIKNIWTSTFALFSGGAGLLVLACLTAISDRPRMRPCCSRRGCLGPIRCWPTSFAGC
jgi:predicted acyltransferase